MFDGIVKNEVVGSFSRRQQLFFRYVIFVLIDLTVINLFNEYWGYVFIESFSISLMVALLLQVLLQLTILIEHRVANYFNKKATFKAKLLRILSAWAILFSSKLIILEAINIFFGDSVVFSGPIHGLVSFIAVVIVIITVEQIFLFGHRKLASKSDEDF
ncbi:hypothetical protein [sulfur-oxidizing endosymbiont of Gigantopelta aegis]|uniref:hypothetical protein n=1 Tax=sulfur-oxidizing endosymbiont of Gigantopelta aegis TaxID=2794934 RepID=UPI0018DC158E|nr:hypothetical protein [sulfur-oxidizing endosymbiont of Gigantopelta aegis]